MDAYIANRRFPNVRKTLQNEYKFVDKRTDFLTTHKSEMVKYIDKVEAPQNVDFTNVANADEFNAALKNAYFEEMKVEMMTHTSELVHTLDQIVKMPKFPVNLTTFNSKDWHALTKWSGTWGFYSTDSFKLRFHIATSGIFENINYQNMFLSGSIIAVCLYKNPIEREFGIEDFDDGSMPLAELTAKWSSNAQNFLRYLDVFYPSKAALKEQPTSKYAVYAAEQNLSDIDIIIDKNDNPDYDFIVKRFFHNLKCEGKSLIRVSTARSYKYVISSANLRYNIECFRVYSSTPMNTVTRYHFPIVRQMFDGNNVYLAPSCVILGLTGICNDYKWMACKNNAIELVLKYYSRGYNFNLNDKEHAFVNKYITSAEKWQYLLTSGGRLEPDKLHTGLHHQLR